MRVVLAGYLLAATLIGFSPRTTAQEQGVEERLRETLRRTMVELRSLQDSQTALQAKLEEAQKQRDQAQQAVQELTAKLAAAQAAAPAAAVPAVPPEELKRLNDQIERMKAENASLRAGLARWQGAYQQAAQLAQAKDAQARDLDGKLKANSAMLGIAMSKNSQLIAIANDILHLYSTRSFRSLLLGSYEPLLGFKKVELENMVQDYEDKIRAQRYYGNERPASPTPPAPARGAPSAP